MKFKCTSLEKSELWEGQFHYKAIFSSIGDEKTGDPFLQTFLTIESYDNLKYKVGEEYKFNLPSS